MDTRHFDALTRALFRPVSRRTVLGVLLAGLPTAVAGADAAGGKGGKGGGGKKRQRRGRGSSAPTCHDRVRNGTETDVDWRGWMPALPQRQAMPRPGRLRERAVREWGLPGVRGGY